MTTVEYDAALVEAIIARLDLRAPNASALRAVAEQLSKPDHPDELICDLATGVGKTYLAAGLVEYLWTQGIRNILFVTPGTTIQQKTIHNFTPGSPKYIPGGYCEPFLVTAESYQRGQVGDALARADVLKLFVFNVQQLIRPSAKASRKVRRPDEATGLLGGLYEHLRSSDDLVVIADEQHVYRESARAFNSALVDLDAIATVGLTATPDPADLPSVIYRYTLAEAIADGYVKVPVIVYREDGIRDTDTQLEDACHLRSLKEAVWSRWATETGRTIIHPVLFVVCQTISEAEKTAEKLCSGHLLGEQGQVLLVTSQSSEKALAALESVEHEASPVRAVVSVDKLKEGWDVKNIGVIIALRALASETLTEQILGRGLRLPFGQRVGIPAIDQIDLVAHDSYRQLLAQKDALLQRLAPVRPGLRGQAASLDSDLGGEQSAKSPADLVKSGQQGTLRLTTRPDLADDTDEPAADDDDDDPLEGEELLQLTPFETREHQTQRDSTTVSQVLYKVDGAPTIKFPRRESHVLPVRFSLSAVRNADAQAVGAGFAQEFPVRLTRKALTAERDVSGDVRVTERRVKDESATQHYMPVEEVRQELDDRIWGLGLVEQTFPEMRAATRITEQFLAGAGVTDPSAQALWSERRTQQAVAAIAELVSASYNSRRLQPQFIFRVVEIPIRSMMPGDVGSRWEPFVKRRWFAGWDKSIQPVANFDAKTTEWTLANLFDSSPSVQWWLRLYEPGEAWIERNNGRRYYPDFIVLDTDGVYWLVEGKSDRDARDLDVIDKREAAEEWARTVRDDGRFDVWRYLFATESMIKNSLSWPELIARARPEL